MKGWYIAARPGTEGDTTIWYTSFWYFIAKYAAVRLGERWCLTADQSLDLYSGKTTVPVQVDVYKRQIDRVILKDMPGGSAEIVRLTPVNMVCHYTYEVNGLRGLDRVADLRADVYKRQGKYRYMFT